MYLPDQLPTRLNTITSSSFLEPEVGMQLERNMPQRWVVSLEIMTTDLQGARGPALSTVIHPWFPHALLRLFHTPFSLLKPPAQHPPFILGWVLWILFHWENRSNQKGNLSSSHHWISPNTQAQPVSEPRSFASPPLRGWTVHSYQRPLLLPSQPHSRAPQCSFLSVTPQSALTAPARPLTPGYAV